MSGLRIGEMMHIPPEALGLPRNQATAHGRVIAISGSTITIDFWRQSGGYFWRKRHRRMAGK